MLNAYSLQTTFFVTFGRIFDKRRDVYSVHRVVEDTIANPSLFSKSPLRDRKRKASRISDVDPGWLVQYIDNAWEPTRADLETLRVALAPNYAKFKTIYQPIRHQVFAHKSIQDDKAIVALFEKTLITDVQEILRFLHTLFWAIWEMAWNGKRPDLRGFSFLRRGSEASHQQDRGVHSRVALTLTPVKTPDGQAVSGLGALFFIRKLRNYREGFGF